jgi:hypothetical protein
MSKSATTDHDARFAQGAALHPDEIRQQLHAILESPVFHGSKRCQHFLSYVCERSLAGASDDLKERTIAIEVFGRQPELDLGGDTIVRVGAREVRKRLAQYYVTAEGAAAEIRIDLPPGSYVPEFRHLAATAERPAVAPAAIEPPPVRQRRLWPWIAAAVVGVAALIVVWGPWRTVNPREEAFRRFWAPAVDSSEPLLIAVAHPLVYHPSLRALKLSEERLPPLDTPAQRPVQLPAKAIDGSDLVPVSNQYVGFGDMMVVTQVSSMLAHRSRASRVRLASAVDFAELRQAGPTLLVGSITNRWTMELQPAWRFQFRQSELLTAVIVDTQDGSGKPAPPEKRRTWSIPAKEDGSAPGDYILICRTRNTTTGGFLLVAAGLKMFGTEAAGRLLTDPDQLGAILGKLQPGWDSHNLQVVLHAKVIGNTPAPPEVVAWHVW